MKQTKRTIVVLLSGGQDSTTCLFWTAYNFNPAKIIALSINYGQRHEVELQAAQQVLEVFKRYHPDIQVDHEILDVGPILAGTSPLTNKALAVETYASVDVLPGGLEKTFVPGRNMLFLTLAGNRAKLAGADMIVTGTAEEDFGGYPDCRRVFMDAMEDVLDYGLNLKAGTSSAITIATPLMFLSKKQTVDMAKEIPGCLEALGWSHTCYQGQVPPCGECHACHLRIRGFAQAGVSDPLVVRLQASP